MVVFGAAVPSGCVVESAAGAVEHVVPVQGGAQPCVGGVGGEPAGAQRGEFFDDPAVPVPAQWDGSIRQGVAGGEPADPVAQCGPLVGGGRAVQGCPTPGS